MGTKSICKMLLFMLGFQKKVLMIIITSSGLEKSMNSTLRQIWIKTLASLGNLWKLKFQIETIERKQSNQKRNNAMRTILSLRTGPNQYPRSYILYKIKNQWKRLVCLKILNLWWARRMATQVHNKLKYKTICNQLDKFRIKCTDYLRVMWVQ